MKALAKCKTVDDMQGVLRSAVDEGGRPLNPIHLSVVFTRLPELLGDEQAKLLVVSEVAADIEQQIARGFLHPNTGIVTTQGLTNVATGFIRLGLADD